MGIPIGSIVTEALAGLAVRLGNISKDGDKGVVEDVLGVVVLGHLHPMLGCTASGCRAASCRAAAPPRVAGGTLTL